MKKNRGGERGFVAAVIVVTVIVLSVLFIPSAQAAGTQAVGADLLQASSSGPSQTDGLAIGIAIGLAIVGCVTIIVRTRGR